MNAPRPKMFLLDTDAGWIGFEREAGALPTATDPGLPGRLDADSPSRVGNPAPGPARPTPMSSSRRRIALLAGALAAALLAAAVAAWSPTRSNANDAGWLDSLDRVQGSWVSVAGFAYDGTTPWTAPVRLTVDGDQLGLYGGCNHLSAEVTVREHRLQAGGGVATTEMGCAPDLHARDAWLGALIEEHATIQLKGSEQGPMLMLDTDAGWIGFVRGTLTPSPSVSDPDEPVGSPPA